LVYRFIIDRAGNVETCDVIVDRVIGPYDTSSEWDEFVASLISALKVLKFPPAHGTTTVIQPILFGGPLQ